VQQVLGWHNSHITTWGAQINVCSLQYGQSKDVLVFLKVPSSVPPNVDFVTATLRYEDTKSGNQVELVSQCSSFNNGGVDLEVNNLRLAFVSTVTHVLTLAQDDKDKEARAALADLKERVQQCADPRAKALLRDIVGQVSEAIQKQPNDYFQKWGRYYLPSLVRAHLLQQCNNFKDPGIQVYGGPLFMQKRDQIAEIFRTLPPPPKPTVRRQSHSSSSYSSSALVRDHRGLVRDKDT
jgi:VWA / Hh  protein intein-like